LFNTLVCKQFLDKMSLRLTAGWYSMTVYLVIDYTFSTKRIHLFANVLTETQPMYIVLYYVRVI